MSEIELILAKLRIVSEEEERGMYLCDKEHSKLLLDYITNLQEEKENQAHTIKSLLEENERLKEERQNINNRNYNQKIANRKLMEDIEKLRTNLKTNKRRRKKQTHKKNIYKLRNEKAIEYIEQEGNLGYWLNKEWWKSKEAIDLLDILQGEDKE